MKERVCLLATTFVDYSANLAAQLTPHHEVVLIADKRLAKEPTTARVIAGLPRERCKIALLSQARIWNRFFFVVSALLLIVRFRPAVLISHEHAHPHVAWLFRVASWLSRSVLIVHDPSPHVGRDTDLVQRNRWARDWQRSAAREFLAHGSYCVDQLNMLVGVRRVITNIPLAPQFYPELPFEFTTGNRLLIFGRMEEYKGLTVALEAIKHLRSSGVQFDVRVVGSGPELDRLQQQLLALDCTVVNRFVTVAEALEHFEWASVVVAPYLEATQSGIVALAFACGRPVIASAVGGLPDFVLAETNGILVPPRDPEGLARSLEHLLRDEHRLAVLSSNAGRPGTRSWMEVGNRVRQVIQQ